MMDPTRRIRESTAPAAPGDGGPHDARAATTDPCRGRGPALTRRAARRGLRTVVPVLAAFLLTTVLQGADLPADANGPIDFESRILPVLRQNCLACHNRTRAKSGLILETPQAILKGGDNGPGLVPGSGAESRVYRAAAHLIEDLTMPPSGNKSNARDLTPEELDLLKRWIDQGAHGEVTGASAVAWQPMPSDWHPALAVAISPDDQLVACSRANRIDLYRLASRRFLGGLEDSEVGHAAHRDVVSALAFNPDGTRLASGGYREVKLWRRHPVLREPAILVPDTGRWTAFAATEDGEHNAACTDDGRIVLFDSHQRPLEPIPVGSGPILALEFSSDGLRLAAASRNGEVTVLDTASGGVVARAESAPEPLALLWLAGDRQIAAGIRGETALRRWEFPGTDRDALGPLPGLEGLPSPIAGAHALGGDARNVLLVCAKGELVIRSVLEPQASGAVPFSHGSPVSAIAISADGAQVATAGTHGGVKLWDVRGDTPKVAAEFKGDWRLDFTAAAAEQVLEFTRQEVDARKKAAQEAGKAAEDAAQALSKATEKHAANDKALTGLRGELKAQEEIQAAAEKERKELAASLESATKAAEDSASASRTAEAAANAAIAKRSDADASRAEATRLVSELARLAFAAGQAKAASERVAAETPAKLKQAEANLAAASKQIMDIQGKMAKAGISLSTSEGDLSLARRNAEAATQALAAAKTALGAAESDLSRVQTAAENDRRTAAAAASVAAVRLAFSSDGHLLAAVTADARLLAWETSTGTPVEAVSLPCGGVLGVAFRGRTRIRVASASGVFEGDLAPQWVLDRTLGTGDARSPFVDRVTALAFSPDGGRLATGGGEPSRAGELKVWSVRDGSLLQDLGAVHSDTVLALAFSPDGDRLLSGGADRFARLTDLASGTVVRNFEGHAHHVLGVAWSRDGRTIATAGADAVVKLWNPGTGERIKTVDGFGKEVVAVQAVGIAGEFLAVSGSGDARVFRADGSKVQGLDAGGAFLESLAVTPDGRFAVAGDADGRARVWRLQNGELAATFTAGNLELGGN